MAWLNDMAGQIQNNANKGLETSAFGVAEPKFRAPTPAPVSPSLGGGGAATGMPQGLAGGPPPDDPNQLLQHIVVLLTDIRAIDTQVMNAQNNLLIETNKQARFGGSPAARRTAAAMAGAGMNVQEPESPSLHHQTGRMHPPAEAPQSPSVQHDPFIPQGYGAGRSVSLGDIKQNVAGRMAERMSGWEMGPEAMKAPQVAGLHGPQGYFVHDEHGRVSDYAAPGTKQYRKIKRQKTMTSTAKNIVGNIGQGENLGASISSAIPAVGKAAGAVGLGVKAVEWGFDFAESQRRAGLEYQQTLGISQNDALGERFKTYAFQLGQKGVMGGEEAAELRKGAMHIYGGNNRNRIRGEEFGVDMYKDLGMNVTESLAIMKTASDNGVQSLNEVAKALKGVSETAKDFGGNAEEARKHFEAIFQTSSAQFGGPGGTAQAQAMANVQTAAGDRFKDWKFQGMNSQQVRRVAGQMGIRPNQLFALGKDAAGQAVIARAREGDAKTKLSGMFGPQSKKFINDYLASHGGKVTDWDELAQSVMNIRDCPDAMQVYLILQQQGIELPDGKDPHTDPIAVMIMALQLAIKEGALGSGKLDEQAKAEAAKKSSNDVGSLDASKTATVAVKGVDEGNEKYSDEERKNLKMRGLTDEQIDKGKNVGSDHAAASAKLRAQFGLSGEQIGADLDTGNFMPAEDRARNLYLNMFKKGEIKDRNLAAESLVSKENFDSDRKFIVQTKDGPREVNTDDLVRYYQDQLAKGDVKISSGKGAGKTTSEYLHYKADPTHITKSDQENAKAGDKVDPSKLTPQGDKAEPFKLIVGIDPKAKGIINAYPGSPNIQVNQGAGQAGDGKTSSTTRPTG